MKLATKLVTLLCLVAFVGAVNAEEACSTGCCAITKAMAGLPTFVYKVGDKTTDCPVEAGRMARKTDQQVKYVGAGKEFPVEADAFAYTVEQTEKMVAKFAEPSKCKVSGQISVAGKKVCCDVAAGEIAAIAKKAMDTVQVTYLVGKTSVCCPDKAKALAAKSGEKVVQCVGETKLGGCGLSKRLTVARAKYKAALEAIAATEKKDTEKSET